MATAVLYFNFPERKQDKIAAVDVEHIIEHVNESIAEANADAKQVGKQLLDQTLTFSSLLRQTKYPTFVYKRDRLLFWSDNTITPEPGLVPIVSEPTTIANSYGTFILVQHRVPGYTIAVYVPLQTNYRLRNNYVTSKLQEHIFGEHHAKLVLDEHAQLPQVRTATNRFLFALDIDSDKAGTGSQADTLMFLLLGAGIIFYVLFALSWSNRLFRKKKYNLGISLLLFLLVLLRVLLLVFNLPYAIAEIELFNPRLYASSFWSPSIGDLGLNMVLLATVSWSALYLFRKHNVLAQIKYLPKQQRQYLQAGCMLALYLLLLVLFMFYYGIYHNTPMALDITQSLDFDRYKIVILGIMVIQTASLSVFAYILASVVAVLQQWEDKLWPIQLLSAVAAVLLLSAVVLAPHLIGIVLIGLFFWLVILFSQRQNTINFPYRTYLFLFLVIIVSALTGATSLFVHYQNELKVYKQKFAFSLLQENDVYGEYLLDEVAKKISVDELIQAKMRGPYVDALFIKQKIVRQYLHNYFDKYDTNVLLFDSEGRSLESADTTAATLQDLRMKYDTPKTRTERKNLFLVKDPVRYNERTYLKLIDVPVSKHMKGTVVLQLSLKRLQPNSLVPELLTEEGSSQPLRTDRLSYAIYQNNKLVFNEGDFDYASNFDKALLENEELFQQGLTQGGFHHLGVLDDNGELLVITTEQYGGREILSNFSFLFLVITTGFILLAVLVLLLERHRLKQFRPNFSTKIQLFLNFGILLPLLLVSITTASLVTSSYKKDLLRSYEQRGKAIQESLGRQITPELLQDKERLLRRVKEIAAIAEADINLYNRNGMLLATSQPLLFDAGLLSQLVNPKAFATISERQALRALLSEQTGNLIFNTLYLPLHQGNDSGKLTGYLGIPFFDSEKQLDLKLIELTTTTMNIFTVMFILFMVLTFFASRALTVPLRLLADKLKRTSLTGKNEMLAYEGADEIGLLVNEYNRMLLTLEQNKVELAMREKEAAWREMARQVAHEIKNPLTPMKLSLQYLQKAIAEKKPNTEQLIEKISQTLITQINILSDIATSFSNFTAMPEPKAELMDVAAALRKAADLHNDPASATLRTDITTEAVMVMADESLMVRTFNNLLLNAIQAVPTTRKPLLHVALKVQQAEGVVLISIKDNGSGIPWEVRGKVFIPNFSTKYTGSGIGLAVAKKGIENAGGRIWFETEEGKGTTFFISLPLASP
ncbi:ATP-binding protein [Pontibacter ruber]|uniref:ATP-binding protein n=1 Tax=Pontibacter ruber TaxID=1343895 RepID=UPI0020279D20|nr:HAMP domain-containing sensor histidine kinase [Pontibacter ruber]